MLECCDVPLEKIMANEHKTGGVCYLGDINRFVATIQE